MRKREGSELSVAAVHLERALREPGCPICRRIRETEERWIWNVLYELTGDPEIHERFAASLGLCREHAALLAQVVETRELLTPTGVARLYESVVTRALTALAELGGRTKALSKEECPLCVLAKDAEDRQSWFFAQLLGDPGFWGLYEGSDGLCLPHLLSVWAQAPGHVRPALLADFRRRLAQLLQRLREFQRKERFDVAEAPTAEELRSWREALWRLSGMTYPGPLIKRG